MSALPKPASTAPAGSRTPYYRPVAGETQVFHYAYESRLPLLLKSPKQPPPRPKKNKPR